ncbi:MAG: FAD-dependent oxidoreductase, partial [Kiritimatiellae bacterium]|nr:FAD-dependent oxidoreductase [Kiritimatiellia bacterium]
MKKIVWASCAVWMAAAVQAEVVTADLVIYGSSPAAVSAAVKAVDMGLKPVVVSPERHVGGLSVSGLGFTDSGNTSSIGGLARQFYHRIYLAYQEPSAWRWERMEDFKAGGQGTKAIVHAEQTMWTFEPHVAERVFAAWLAEKGVPVRRGEFLDREKGVKKADGRIVSIATLSGNTYRGRYFIDATYEGDLMAAAGVPYRVGRESCSEFGETWNGNQVGVLHHKHHFRDWKVSPYKVPGDPSSGLCALVDTSAPGVRGAGDRRVQAYCYRLCMTDDPRNRLPFEKPSGYDPARYALLARVYAQGYSETFAKFDRIANHKTDTNNHG